MASERGDGRKMSTRKIGTGTPCPWCRDGHIVVHAPNEEWWVTEEGDAAAASYSGKFPAGIRRKRFKTPPVEWFSCTSCAMTGTTGYLSTVIDRVAGKPGSSLASSSSSAVKRGSLAGVLT